jgi:hypothetical protein
MHDRVADVTTTGGVLAPRFRRTTTCGVGVLPEDVVSVYMKSLTPSLSKSPAALARTSPGGENELMTGKTGCWLCARRETARSGRRQAAKTV